jgi:prephenate dehydratase
VGLADCAAIASELAGATYGLEVLDSNIEDDDSNFTRFLLLSRQSIRYWATLCKHACVRLDTCSLAHASYYASRGHRSCGRALNRNLLDCCSSLIPPNIPAKTSIVFVLPNTAGALYKVR